jgi:[ribosomal protein S5]-alanine N-acetyltransferase
MTIPTLETEHLLLRAWRAEDADAWYSVLQEPDLLKYFPDPRPPSRRMADRYIEHHLDHWETYGYGHWVVTTRGDARIVGWTGLEYIAELQQTELAYLLSRSVWGRGYATEAGRAAARFAFDAAGVQELIGLVHPGNAASIRVLEKCGMRLVDRVTLWDLEMCRYRVLRGEYQQAPWRARGAQQPAGG